MTRRKVLVVVAGLLVLALTVLFIRARMPREVAPGVWRSAQPGMRTIRVLVEHEGLQSIINLRGDNPKSGWYQTEQHAVERFDLDYAEYRFETFEPPPRTETVGFVEDLISKPKPVLMHCRSGFDRSGWAAANARILAGEPIDEALDEMTPLRGHVCDPSTCPLHGFFTQYQQRLNDQGRTHSPATFVDWVTHEYAPRRYDARISIASVPMTAVAPAAPLHFQVEVSNRSSRQWIATDDRSRGVRLGARIIGPWTGEPPANAESMFRRHRSPARDVYRSDNRIIDIGESVVFDVSLVAPSEPGGYTIQFDMVDEHVGWFSEWGWPGAIVDFTVARE
ncbi:MAG: tyrosine-protein phosphatase [Acidobacteria bacterium]|nr:tyrosine-protein phosphatase [Acidobacteriota bacterium]